MKSAKDILLTVRDFYYRIRTCRLSLEALYQETYGLDLKIGYDKETSGAGDPHAGETVLVNKIELLDKKAERVEKEITHYVELINWLENLCIQTLNDQELLVIRLSFFNKKMLSRDEIARQLRYSSAWVAKTRTSAYQKLDNRLFDLRQEHKLPEEYDDEHI